MKVFHWKSVLLAVMQPLMFVDRFTGWTMSIAATVIMDASVMAMITSFLMPT
jgi:hypothetical protein